MSELSYVAKEDKRVNGQYRFVSHDAVAAKVHPLLVKHGVAVIPSVEEMTQDGNRTTAKVKIWFVNVDNPGEGFHTFHWGYGVDQGDKGPGKAVSYAYKYALLKTLCLETGDDPDVDAKAEYSPVKCMEFDGLLPYMDDKQRKKLDDYLASCAKAMDRHVEDVKREACKRIDEFLTAFNKWKPKKGEVS